jgi:hypothetical protein
MQQMFLNFLLFYKNGQIRRGMCQQKFMTQRTGITLV